MSKLSVEEESAQVKVAELETELELSASSAEMVITSNASQGLPNLVVPISEPPSQFDSDQDPDLDSFLSDTSITTDFDTYPQCN